MVLRSSRMIRRRSVIAEDKDDGKSSSESEMSKGVSGSLCSRMNQWIMRDGESCKKDGLWGLAVSITYADKREEQMRKDEEMAAADSLTGLLTNLCSIKFVLFPTLFWKSTLWEVQRQRLVASCPRGRKLLNGRV